MSSTLTQVTPDGTTTTFTHPQNAHPAADLAGWHPPGTVGRTTVTITPSENTPAAGTTTAAGVVPAALFVRLTASQAAGSP